jgi:hypothetical protein
MLLNKRKPERRGLLVITAVQKKPRSGFWILLAIIALIVRAAGLSHETTSAPVGRSYEQPV